MTLTVGSLFSGIGGLDLGLERAGMRVIWQSEIDSFACKVLKKHWPNVPNLGDIKEIDWNNCERPDVICGGYPCQPFSTAGKRQGTDDPRHLWPWVREAISELRPRYAIMENVRGHLTMGGLAVIGELASIGYDAEWRVVSAASVGANHRRDRLFIVAYPDSERLERSSRFQKGNEESCRSNVFGSNTQRNKGWQGWEWWQSEPELGRVAYGVPDRVDRLKGLGNAVVPQVAEVIGRLVMEASWSR
jgi:DNA (cytosine-5)-methyltransferase 1